MIIANLSIILRLQNQGIYLNSEEGEVVLPNESGMITIDAPDTQKTFTVNENPISSPLSSPLSVCGFGFNCL